MTFFIITAVVVLIVILTNPRALNFSHIHNEMDDLEINNFRNSRRDHFRRLGLHGLRKIPFSYKIMGEESP